jgi:hypothetical protein
VAELREFGLKFGVKNIASAIEWANGRVVECGLPMRIILSVGERHIGFCRAGLNLLSIQSFIP